jgi:hypothetical protein
MDEGIHPNCFLFKVHKFAFVLCGVEGGLFKRAQFREGAHTAHSNHRSKTIYRVIVGACAFDPRGDRALISFLAVFQGRAEMHDHGF